MKIKSSQIKGLPVGLIMIVVVMVFVAFATDYFWIARLSGNAFPPTMPVEPLVYDAFAVPDLVLSLFLYVGAYGLFTCSSKGFG